MWNINNEQKVEIWWFGRTGLMIHMIRAWYSCTYMYMTNPYVTYIMHKKLNTRWLWRTGLMIHMIRAWYSCTYMYMTNPYVTYIMHKKLNIRWLWRTGLMIPMIHAWSIIVKHTVWTHSYYIHDGAVKELWRNIKYTKIVCDISCTWSCYRIGLITHRIHACMIVHIIVLSNRLTNSYNVCFEYMEYLTRDHAVK